jgi:hypothetical protein
MYSNRYYPETLCPSISVTKEEAAADALYQTIINAMRSPNPELLELTCEKQTDKKVAVLSE